MIERARVAGLWLDQVNATIEDLEVDDTQYLLADRVREQGVGIAIGIGQATGDLEIADLKLTRFRLENNAAPGLWLGLGAEYQLSEGWIVGKKGYDTNKIDFKPGIDLAGIRFAEPQGQ